MRRSYVIASITLALLAAGWQFGLGRRWTMRSSRDAVVATRYVGTQTNADSTTGVVPAADALSTYDRTISVTDAADWPRSVLLLDSYTVRDIQTRAVLYKYVTKERVDPRTGALADGPHRGDIVLFPRDVKRRTYILRSNYIRGVPLQFSGEHSLGGLNTYLFSYRGRIDLTAAYSGTAESPGMKIPAGEQIRCADDQFYYRVWVEPVTGEQVKVEEGCPSGDYFYNKITGKQGAAIDRWNGETSGVDLAARVTEVFGARRTYTWAAFYLPGLVVAGSLGCLAAGFWRPHESVLA